MPVVNKAQVKNRKKPAKKKGVKALIKPMHFDKDDPIKMSLYGRSGTGKTTFWATFPGPILALICSGSKDPGELRSVDTPANRKKIETATIENTDDLRQIVEHQKETKKYATIVLDHATALQDLVLFKDILEMDEIPEQKSWGTAGRTEWMECTLRMKTWLRSILDLSCNVVIVAQEREFNTDTEEELLSPFVGSALQPATTGWLNSVSDYICQTHIRSKVVEKSVTIGKKIKTRKVKTGKVEYCLRTGPHEVFQTRFRTARRNNEASVIVDPTFDKVQKLIMSS